MFEKEAEYYAKEKYSPNTDPFIIAVADDAFKDGAQFGYNKASEWHLVKDGLHEMQKENNRLAQHILELQKDKGRLTDENKDLQHRLDVAQSFLDRDKEYQEMNRQLEQAKEIIKRYVDFPTSNDELWELHEKAEQFINNNKIVCDKETGKFFGTVS